MESERDDDDEADSDGDSNAGSFTHEETTSSEPFGGDGCVNLNPTIQVEFALGKLKDNPIMKLLADDDSSEENGSQDSSDREENVAIERAVTTLLAKDACSDGSEKSPLRKKPLITEL